MILQLSRSLLKEREQNDERARVVEQVIRARLARNKKRLIWARTKWATGLSPSFWEERCKDAAEARANLKCKLVTFLNRPRCKFCHIPIQRRDITCMRHMESRRSHALCFDFIKREEKGRLLVWPLGQFSSQVSQSFYNFEIRKLLFGYRINNPKRSAKIKRSKQPRLKRIERHIRRLIPTVDLSPTVT